MIDLAIILSLYFSSIGLVLYAVFGGFIYGAMWMRLPKDRVQKMMELGKVSYGKNVYDLGAGYGNIAFKASSLGAKVTAVEVDPFKAWWINKRIKDKQLTNITAIKGNLLNIDLSNADILLCYLGDGLMDKLAEKQLKSGCQIVSCCHKIRKWQPALIDSKGIYPIYIYNVP